LGEEDGLAVINIENISENISSIGPKTKSRIWAEFKRFSLLSRLAASEQKTWQTHRYRFHLWLYVPSWLNLAAPYLYEGMERCSWLWKWHLWEFQVLALSYSSAITRHYLATRAWVVFYCSMAVGGREIQSVKEINESRSISNRGYFSPFSPVVSAGASSIKKKKIP
jgi:hypothetical protein